jgi:AraC-like DNA-binding protein
MKDASRVVWGLSTLPKAQNAGLFISRGRGRHAERVIESYELIFTRSGTLSMKEGDSDFAVGAGQTLILFPGRRHRGTAPYPSDLSFYWVHFTLPSRGRRPNGRSGRVVVPQHAVAARPELLEELFRRFLDDQQTGQLTPPQADLLVALMLIEAARPRATQPEGLAAALAEQAMRIVRTRFHEPIGASDVARELSANADYLGRVFRVTHGATLTETLHRRRVSAARRLLCDSALRIGEIARECGFSDLSHFRDVFHRHAGMSPGQYRRLHARTHIVAD